MPFLFCPKDPVIGGGSSTYDSIKSQTEANLRAALRNAEAADEAQTDETTTAAGVFSPSRDASATSSPSPQPPRRPKSSSLRLRLDIAAPRILIPQRLWPDGGGEEGGGNPPPSCLGVLCDFGRFRLSNWSAGDQEVSLMSFHSIASQPFHECLRDKQCLPFNSYTFIVGLLVLL